MVNSGEKALELIPLEHPDIVLMDIKIRGTLDGIETAIQIKNRYAIPVIFLTALSDDDTTRRAQAANPYGYIFKPVDFRDLKSTIQLTLYKHRMELQLKENEERFRNLFDKAPVGYQSLDAEGRFIEVNQTWLDILGYTRDEVIGKNFAEFLPPVYKELFKKRFPRFKAAGAVSDVQFELICRDGSTKYMTFTGRIGYDPPGTFKQTHCILQDNTQRKQAEDALKKSEARLRSLFTAVPAGVILQSVDGAIIHANALACEIFGMDECDILTKTSLDPNWEMVDVDGNPVPGEDHPSMITIRSGKPVRNAIRGIFAGNPGKMRWLMINTEPLTDPDTNEISEVLTTFHDITQLKQTGT